MSLVSHHNHGHCGWLASVRNGMEASMVASMGVDIIDMKEPSKGALGAPSVALCRSVWRAWGGRKTLSVAAGDYHLSSVESSLPLVYSLARTGVDVVKVGMRLHESPDDVAWDEASYDRCFSVWRDAVDGHARWACVLFADDRGFRRLWRRVVPKAFAYGCYALVVDTANKTGLSLPRYLSCGEMRDITHCVRACGGVSILAGSLHFSDIAPCGDSSPDYLGFRGLLCEGGRMGVLSMARLRRVARYFPYPSVLSSVMGGEEGESDGRGADIDTAFSVNVVGGVRGTAGRV